MLTNTTDLTLTIRTADCQSFALLAASKKVIGVLHVGWRGLLNGAIPAFFKELKESFEVDPRECIIVAGPSLCQKCADFTDPITELPGVDRIFFDGRCVDLQKIADRQLDEAGVPKTQRERHPGCTRCEPETYWTYRGGDREAVKEGYTNVLAIRLKARP